METTEITRPPQPGAPGGGLIYAIVPAADWRVAEDGTRCTDRSGTRRACGRAAAAEYRSHAGMGPAGPWRGFCEEHAAVRLHWAEDGEVMKWGLRHADGTALTAREAARERARHARRQVDEGRKRPGEGDPWRRGNHSNRFRDDDWQATERAAEAGGMSTTTEMIAHGMEAMQDFLRCDRGDCYMGGPPVPVTWGDLTGKPLGAWITEAVKEIRRQHPRHEPVRIGAEPAAAPAPAPASARTVRFVEPKQAVRS